jgi:NADH-quinone oxidoreductase subunit H
LIVTLFFGGWSLPFAGLDTPATTPLLGFAHVAIFVAKCGLCLFFFMWVRWTLPRFRYDQLMRLCWNVMVPLSVLNLLVTAAILTYWS